MVSLETLFNYRFSHSCRNRSFDKKMHRIMLAFFRIVHTRLFPATNDDVVLSHPMKVDQKKLIDYKQVSKLDITNVSAQWFCST